MADGRRQVVGFLVPGDFLGLAFGRTYVYTAEAITAVAACRFQRSRFMELLEELPALEREILGRTSNELAAAQQQMLLLGRKTARERLASFLADLAERSDADGGPLELPMGRADIADHLGLTIETVSRTFTGLRRRASSTCPRRTNSSSGNPASSHGSRRAERGGGPEGCGTALIKSYAPARSGACPHGEAPFRPGSSITRQRGYRRNVGCARGARRRAPRSGKRPWIARGFRSALPAGYGHPLRPRLLPRCTRCEGVERASQ